MQNNKQGCESVVCRFATAESEGVIPEAHLPCSSSEREQEKHNTDIQSAFIITC